MDLLNNSTSDIIIVRYMSRDKRRKIITCEVCGKQLERILCHANNGRHQFCSKECSNNFKFKKKVKQSKCIYCGEKVNISNKCSHLDTKCKKCFKVWMKLRNKYNDYGENINVHDLVRWYINQPQKCAECGSTKNITIDRKISGKNGGKYELNNIQLLCYKCNCCIKTSFNSVAESQVPLTEKKCNKCGKVLPLTSEYWHKLKPAKYGSCSLCTFHPECKKCRCAREAKRWSVTHPVPQRPSMVKYWDNYKS